MKSKIFIFLQFYLTLNVVFANEMNPTLQCVQNIKSEGRITNLVFRDPTLRGAVAGTLTGAAIGAVVGPQVPRLANATALFMMKQRLGNAIANHKSGNTVKLSVEVNRIIKSSLKGQFVTARRYMSFGNDGIKVKAWKNKPRPKGLRRGGAVLGAQVGYGLSSMILKTIGSKCGSRSSTDNGQRLSKYFSASLVNGCVFEKGGVERLLAEDEGVLRELCKENPNLPETISEIREQFVEKYKSAALPPLLGLNCSENTITFQGKGGPRTLRFEVSSDGVFNIQGTESGYHFSTTYTHGEWGSFNTSPGNFFGSGSLNPMANKAVDVLFGKLLVSSPENNSKELRLAHSLLGFESYANFIQEGCQENGKDAPTSRKNSP